MVEDEGVCPGCGGRRFERDERRDERVCASCGLVLEESELASERSRTARAPGRGTAGQPDRLPRHLARAQRRAEELSSSQRRWVAAKQEAERVAGVLGCPRDVAHEAARLILKAREANLTQGRSLDALAAAGLIASCRRLQFPRTEAQVAEASSADQPTIQAAYKALVQGLELAIPPAMATDYLPQLASELAVPAPVQAEAADLLASVCGTRQAAGKNPRGWAAGALVLASRSSQAPLSMNRAAKAAGVSDSTVKARLEELEAIRGQS